jgi:hypothetical protein
VLIRSDIAPKASVPKSRIAKATMKLATGPAATVVRSAARRRPLQQRGPETDGEVVDPHAVEPGQQKVAALVEHDQHREHEQEDGDSRQVVDEGQRQQRNRCRHHHTLP